MPLPARLLLVEDDTALAGQIGEYLAPHGFRVEHEPRGDRAARRIVEERPDLVVLDLGLPGLDGLDVCRLVRPAYRGPVLILTARAEDADQILGLESGADDFLVKPTKPRILLARVRALLRRVSASEVERPSHLQVGDLQLDPESREATVAGAPLPLTTAEFELLWVLASNAGQVVSRKFLHETLCGTEYDPVERAIDLRVSRLRHKLGTDVIKTVRGTGYLHVRS